MIGKELLHYKIIEKLGAGGMGAVYLAEDLRLERKVALKFLSPIIANNADAVKNSLRKLKLQPRLVTQILPRYMQSKNLTAIHLSFFNI